MTTIAKRAAELKGHFKQKVANRDWLGECYLDGEADSFPYRPEEGGKAKIGKLLFPYPPSAQWVMPPGDRSPLFLTNIPMGRLPSEGNDDSKYRAILNRFRNESFGATAAKSAKEVKKRVAIVLGINQIESIDPALNRTFKEFIYSLPQVDGVVHRTLGFFWKPKWVKDLGVMPKGKVEKAKWKALNKRVYSRKKAFLLLKGLSSSSAEKVRKAHEEPEGLHEDIKSQIPYQQIRQTIKNCRLTRKFMDQMERDAPKSPIYFTTMDADCLSLRASTQMGIFSRLEDLISEHDEPSIVSLGYSLKADEPPLLRLAVEIDMAVRSTMPLPYISEPCAAYKVRLPREENFLSKMSFIGRGRGLESRRFIENGRDKLKDGVVFKGDGGVVTTTPTRMKTAYNQSVEELTSAILKKKGSLQALRSSRIQSHAFPKQWADILYAGLPFSCSQVTDATTRMMHILNAYDPISRMFTATKYTAKVFDRVMKDYHKPLSDGEQNLVNTARAKLRKLGMNKEMVDLVVETAKRSGEAIYQALKGAIEG